MLHGSVAWWSMVHTQAEAWSELLPHDAVGFNSLP
jgi:hypothetical protein